MSWFISRIDVIIEVFSDFVVEKLFRVSVTKSVTMFLAGITLFGSEWRWGLNGFKIGEGEMLEKGDFKGF